MSDELFPADAVAMDSPRLAWLNEHIIELEKQLAAANAEVERLNLRLDEQPHNVKSKAELVGEILALRAQIAALVKAGDVFYFPSYSFSEQDRRVAAWHAAKQPTQALDRTEAECRAMAEDVRKLHTPDKEGQL